MPKRELIARPSPPGHMILSRRDEDGKEIVILNGKTFEPVRVPKAAVLAMNYGNKSNIAYRIACVLMED